MNEGDASDEGPGGEETHTGDGVGCRQEARDDGCEQEAGDHLAGDVGCLARVVKGVMACHCERTKEGK